MKFASNWIHIILSAIVKRVISKYILAEILSEKLKNYEESLLIYRRFTMLFP